MLAQSSSVSAKRKVKWTTPPSEAELLNFNPNRLSFRSSSRVNPRRNCSGLRPPPESQRAISCNSPDNSLQTSAWSVFTNKSRRPPNRQPHRCRLPGRRKESKRGRQSCDVYGSSYWSIERPQCGCDTVKFSISGFLHMHSQAEEHVNDEDDGDGGGHGVLR